MKETNGKYKQLKAIFEMSLFTIATTRLSFSQSNFYVLCQIPCVFILIYVNFVMCHLPSLFNSLSSPVLWGHLGLKNMENFFSVETAGGHAKF